MAVGCGLTAFSVDVLRRARPLRPLCPQADAALRGWHRSALASVGQERAAIPNRAVEKYGLDYCKRAGELAFKGGGKDSHHRIGTPPEFRDLLLGMAASVARAAA